MQPKCCQECNQDMTGLDMRQITCSKGCKEIRRRRQHRSHYAQLSEAQKNMRREAANKRRLSTFHVCDKCGIKFSPRKPTARYCSTICMADARRKTPAKPKPTPEQIAACVQEVEADRQARAYSAPLGPRRKSFWSDTLRGLGLSGNLKIAAAQLGLSVSTLKKRLQRDPASVFNPLRRYGPRLVTMPLLMSAPNATVSDPRAMTNSIQQYDNIPTDSNCPASEVAG